MPAIEDHATRPPIGRMLGVILAGGQSRRMGMDKGPMLLQGRSLIAHAIDRLAPQVDVLIINANGDPARYGDLGVPIVADTLADYPGPLAGLLAAMRWAIENAPGVTHVATVAVDTPFFPPDLVARLRSALNTGRGPLLAFATTDQGPQPVFGLSDIGLADTLERDIMAGGARRVTDWLRGHAHVEVAFEDSAAFFNVNTPADAAAAETMAVPPPRGTV